MKKHNKFLISILLISFMVFAIIPSFHIIPSAIQTKITFDEVDDQELEPKTSQFIPRTIRVAVYDESNISTPDYGQGGCYNNLTDTLAALISGGYQVTQLTTDDIINHELKTADYDVFVMVDNCPKDNITEFVTEFWLGGGGLLSFDTAISFLCHMGILPPEAVDTDGNPPYWSYVTQPHEIYQRHPISKDYSVGDSFTSLSSRGSFDWTALQGTSIASDIVRIATSNDDINEVSVLGYDPSTGGGRVVQMPWTAGEIPSNMIDLVIDAVDWACPRPKGRILYDLSHIPWYGLDSWDQTNNYAEYGARFYVFRDYLVNRSYTFDKLYPSATGNLTSSNLASYDMLILCTPSVNYTTNEISNIMSWVSNGGSLFVLGGYNSQFDEEDKRINDLLSSTGLNLNLTSMGSAGTVNYKAEHPTVENCGYLEFIVNPNFINYTGNAYPIWGESSKNIIIGGQEYGNGRIILSGDFYFIRFDYIHLESNLRFAINAVNWLTATTAKVLVMIKDHSALDPNDNVYKGPVATALNDLGIKFYLTETCSYFNLSLYSNEWDLLIVDEVQNAGHIDEYASDLITYMKNGGYLILYSYREQYASPLWKYLGFTPEGAELTTPPVVYIWDTGHPIFNNPANYNANNITTSLTPYGTDFVNVTLYNNATGIAGLTPTSSDVNQTIILSANGHAITNTFGLTEYYDDTDDSTYPDALEIWENEIAYMTYQSLSVHINTPHPDDLFDATAPSFSITTDGIIIDELYYTLNGGTNHPITSNTGIINQGSWDALPEGSVSLEFYAEDTAGESVSAGVNIEKDTQAPIIEILSPTSGQTINDTAPQFIVNITEPHLDKMWYTVDAGLANFTFTSNGTINQAAWDALSEGTVTIGFYANDTLGHESFKQVSVNFDIPSSKRKGIPGYDTYLIIGVISVISVLILESRLKRLKLNK